MTVDPAADLFRPARPRRAFDEIITQVGQLIEDGHLSPGDRLPPERVLAERFALAETPFAGLHNCFDTASILRG
ncbi:GntR family transcriptional regulator [Jatrophihabitans lederbergiae]|uniref:GntR family transcriptional regulator n=1 Tax=Jatrophihabitans lederbergiae TaxID=3075547 RepID=A0ABU2JF98_9ACTN|nr:GntR family transcriptional regulator [Jatrophihabitans sp. DSM 44399]MDT0263651.1 GntR family transcriptional regulator [Jatrophihabitans sp. DSM 44399]